MDFHDELRSKFGAALVAACCKRGCSLSFESLNHRPAVMDADKYAALGGHRRAICDYLVFPVHPKIIPVAVEMKAGGVDARHAVRQLRAGAELAETITEGRDVGTFYPLLLSQAVGHPSEVKVLGRSKIRYRGRDYPVTRRRCGVRLSVIIPELASR